MNSISPIDGRYVDQVKELQPFFSENAIMKYRVKVEIEYLIELSKTLGKPEILELEQYPCGCSHYPNPREDWTDEQHLRDMYESFEENEDFTCVKAYEKKTRHDVKAVELYIREDMAHPEWVHFGLTSQDINNTAIPLLLNDALVNVIHPLLSEDGENSLVQDLYDWVVKCGDVRMLGRTHGQPATPVDLGEQFKVFWTRLTNQHFAVTEVPISAKFGGATGGMNAHYLAFPKVDWYKFSKNFLRRLGLEKSHPTTQIEHYDNLAALCQGFARINTILIDFCRDMWQYISMGYFKIKTTDDEVGSSTMPHKVNPIDFENAEGNLGVANALFNHFAAKLPISRLQRDLTDSTVLRNLGVPFAHSVIAYKAIRRGLSKLEVNHAEISRDLQNHWEVVTEGIQTILRREGVNNAYDLLKEFAKSDPINEQTVGEFIKSLNVRDEVKAELRKIRPETY